MKTGSSQAQTFVATSKRNYYFKVEPAWAMGGGASLEEVQDERAARSAVRECGLIHRVSPAVPPVRPKTPAKPSQPADGTSI